MVTIWLQIVSHGRKPPPKPDTMGAMTAPDVTIKLVTLESTGELLTLQRAAFVSEALEAGDLSLPVLSQTYDELREELSDPAIVPVGAWLGSRLVASVRIRVAGNRADISRLVVAPDLQGQGISTALIMGAAPFVPDSVSEVWVLTARDDARTLESYAASGGESQLDHSADRITQAFLRKIAAGTSA